MAKGKNFAVVSCEAEITPRRVKKFLNTEVKDYAKYVIETRAIPSIMDGLRVGARKILYAALTGDMKKGAKVKMPTLIGDTMKQEYHHGDAALLNTIVQLSNPYSLNVPPFYIIGQIGTLRVPDTEVAPRYLHVRYSQWIDIFKKDLELCTHNIEDGKTVEPKFFLPILPLVLLWRTNNPGFGFSFRGFSFDINDVINACLTTILQGGCDGISGDYVQLKPQIHSIKPENIIYNESKKAWFNVGEYQMHEDIDTLIITDLPYDISYDKLEDRLHDLKESNYIVDFTNRSNKGEIKYIIKFAKGRLKLLSAEKWKFFKNFHLFSKIPKLTLNCWDIDGTTIMQFETPQELIKAFVSRRLRFYAQRKIRTIRLIEEKIQELSEKAMFIDLVINDKLIINKRKIEDIKKDLSGYKIRAEVLKMPISKLTKEEHEELLKEIGDFKAELNYIKNTSIENMYIQELVELKQKFLADTIIKPTRQ